MLVQFEFFSKFAKNSFTRKYNCSLKYSILCPKKKKKKMRSWTIDTKQPLKEDKEFNTLAEPREDKNLN